MVSLLRKYSLWVLLTIAAPCFADDPQGFTAPDGFSEYRSETVDNQKFEGDEEYLCVSSKKRCDSKTQGFDDDGRLIAEGKIELAVYYKPGNNSELGVSLQKYYEKTIARMGGRLIANMAGQDEGHGKMKRVYFLEKAGVKKWVHVDTSSDKSQAWLSVITASDGS